MTERPPRLQWLPPLLVGVSAAVVAEVAMAILLYGGPGLVKSLTTILAVAGFAFAGGLSSAPPVTDDLVERIRRRWLLCLFSFLAAAVFGTAWSFEPMLGQARWGQAAGLTLLAALPLSAAGSVLAGISTAARSDPGGLLRGPAAPAATGLAIGFVMTGFLLPRVPLPASMLIGCLVLLSLGGMVFGSVIGGRTEIEVVASRPSHNGEVVVRERRLPLHDVAKRELLEGGYLRHEMDLRSEAGAETPAWDVAAARAFMPSPDVRWRVLSIGGGVSSLPKGVAAHPCGEVDVAERTAAVVELGRDHFDTALTVGGGDRVSVAVGNLDDLVATLATSYDLVVIDIRALLPIGDVAGLSRATRWRLLDAVDPGGVVLVGPIASAVGLRELDTGWEQRTYRHGASGDVVVAARRPTSASPEWPAVFDGFARE